MSKKHMKNNTDTKKIAIENINGDIGLLTLQSRLKKDTYLRKTIIMEKLSLLYCMDIINSNIYHEYKETIKLL